MRLYPGRVRLLTARVTAECLIDQNGRFSSCKILAEDPPSKGFGEATIKLSQLFQMKTLDAEGLPVAGRKLTLPVVWRTEYSP